MWQKSSVEDAQQEAQGKIIIKVGFVQRMAKFIGSR